MKTETCCDAPVWFASLFIGVGLFAKIVTILVAPLLPVVVITSVTTEGVLVVVWPALLVVTITTVDCNVVLFESSACGTKELLDMILTVEL